ncbi:MAG: SDR family NAD(P)-dependent oxidoreductase, partial [Bradyrhizobiaceae bacterium]|nr:SDR family NAD(P)-dependent oxidoreductase [Bradyrhizobiaceae bacterium]
HQSRLLSPFQPFPHFAEYAAGKAFVLSFTESLAEELKETGVRVLALCPGPVRTEIDIFAHNEGLPSLSAKRVVQVGLRAVGQGAVVKIVEGSIHFCRWWAALRLAELSVG